MTTRTTILAVGITDATSSTVTIEKGETVKIGIFTSTANATLGSEQFTIAEKTAGVSNPLGKLDKSNPSYLIDGPGEIEVYRTALSGVGFGVYKEA